MYETMTANDKRSFLFYLNKLVDKCSSTNNRSIGKKNLLPLIILVCLKYRGKS